MTTGRKHGIMETKKGYFVSSMRDKIVEASIEALRNEGLKFSVDTLADSLRISKKTVYKFFPDKEALALALYEKYYTDTVHKARILIGRNTPLSKKELLDLYFDSKTMTRRDIFNKYKLNGTIAAFAASKNDELWSLIASSLRKEKTDQQTLRIIVDGAFEKLCNDGFNPDKVIKRLVDVLW